MSKYYKLNANTRFGAAGEVVTEQHLKDSGADVDDMTRRKLLESSTAPAAARTDTPGIPTDEQNKLNVENAIRDATVEAGQPLTPAERDKLAAEVTADSGRPIRTDGKDVGKAEALQAKARKADEKAAAKEGQR